METDVVSLQTVSVSEAATTLTVIVLLEYTFLILNFKLFIVHGVTKLSDPF